MLEKRIKVFDGLGIVRRNGSIWGKYGEVSLFSPKKNPTYIFIKFIPSF
jgi:hypothetical protein